MRAGAVLGAYQARGRPGWSQAVAFHDVRCGSLNLSETTNSVQSRDYVQIRQNPEGGVGVGFAVGAEADAGNAFQSGEIAGFDVFERLALARVDVELSDMHGDGRGSYEQGVIILQK